MSTEDKKEEVQGTPVKKATKVLVQTKEPEQLIYVGPPMRQDGVSIRTNQLFIGGRPPYLQVLYDVYPLMIHLFVPVVQLADANKKLKQIGSMLNTAYRSMEEV
ncbi:hypothetical protein QUF95_15505 [Paenibacillus silvae]|uniref:hypothetical protein n=1 Tax=Paenibacillus silvae TaxID=1325358 RepID=UPI0025A059DA|nr:hypothetical protein [Paenibacillus silvae]MDM5278804.1 hypothetical protein [Paenibacillus silvae]